MEQTITERIRAEAFNETQKTYAKRDPREYIDKLWEKFIELKVKAFPEICEVARVQNIIKWESLRKEGSKGKYSDSYGWSKDGTFKFDFEIPQELYLFMVNLVYKNFWEESNRRVWRKFMNKVCKGEDAWQILKWVKAIYGEATPDMVN